MEGLFSRMEIRVMMMDRDRRIMDESIISTGDIIQRSDPVPERFFVIVIVIIVVVVVGVVGIIVIGALVGIRGLVVFRRGGRRGAT